MIKIMYNNLFNNEYLLFRISHNEFCSDKHIDANP